MSSNPYSAPTAPISEPGVSRSYNGLRRLPFFGWTVLLTLVYSFGVVLSAEAPAIGLACMGLMLAGSLYLYVLRFRNQGSSGLWALGMFVPLLNLYTGLRALAFPEGYADHRTLDTPARVLIGVWLLSLVLGVAAAILIPMLALQS